MSGSRVRRRSTSCGATPGFRCPPPTDTPCNTPGPATSTTTDATNSSSIGSPRPATSRTFSRRTRSPARGCGASTSARARTPRSAGTAPTTPRPPRSAARRRLYATTEPTKTRIYTLAQNPGYRLGWTVRGYLQSTYTDYYLGTQTRRVQKPALTTAARTEGTS
ncbi:rhamnogalacturonan lyase family protein [Streptomyces mirabilis]|uniref:rhamnogalacturonan lyase family protein n=1 Tax=Streptomyces mirabilis TaxID=68239 RepID=UPI0036BE8F62